MKDSNCSLKQAFLGNCVEILSLKNGAKSDLFRWSRSVRCEVVISDVASWKNCYGKLR